MKLNLKFFSHEVAAHAHPKMEILIDRYGLEGYGRFWILCELIGISEGCLLDLTNQVTRRNIYAKLKFKDKKEMDDFIVFLSSEECDLIYSPDEYPGVYTTETAQERLNATMKDRQSAAERNKQYRKRKIGERDASQSNSNASHRQSDASHRENDALDLTDYTILNKTKDIDTNVSIGDTNVSPPLEPDEYSILKSEYEKLPKEKIPIYQFLKTGKAQKVGLLEPYVDLWNIFAEETGKPGIKALNKKRKGHLLARLKDHYPGKKGQPKVFCFDFAQVLKKAKESEFLMTENNWFGFDWLIKNDTNYMKVLEGNYANKPKETEPPKESIYDKLMRPAGSPTVGQA